MSRRLSPRPRAALPIALGSISALITLYAWSQFAPLPFWGDEAAYTLQAEVFATGSWTSPSPPLPEFFEQTHVLVEPVLASKYAPGHSLLLAIGALVGWVTLVPLLLTGVTGGLVYALADRLAGGRVALLTWWLWTASPESLRWRTSYLSQVTTACLLMFAWWQLLRWRERPTTTRLAWLAAALGLGAATRPYTMFLLAIPIGFIVLRDVFKRRGWRELVVPTAIGMVFLAIIPIWSYSTLGSVRETPRETYTRVYMPWDRMGFDLRDAPAERPANPEMAGLTEEFKALHRDHVVDRLPALAAERFAAMAYVEWLGWRLALPLLAIAGAIALPRYALFAFLSFGSLFGGHLLYTHGTAWSVYYIETLPASSFFASVGMLALARRLRPLSRLKASESAERALFAGLFLALIGAGTFHVQRIHRLKSAVLRPGARVAACFDGLPAGSGVFVRYAPDHNDHQSLVGNVASLGEARVVTVHDRGSENYRLVEAMPERSWFTYDEEQDALTPVVLDARESSEILCSD